MSGSQAVGSLLGAPGGWDKLLVVVLVVARSPSARNIASSTMVVVVVEVAPQFAWALRCGDLVDWSPPSQRMNKHWMLLLLLPPFVSLTLRSCDGLNSARTRPCGRVPPPSSQLPTSPLGLVAGGGSIISTG